MSSAIDFCAFAAHSRSNGIVALAVDRIIRAVDLRTAPALLIFDSQRSQVADREGESAPRRCRGTTLPSFAVNQASTIWRRVGGRATPRADSAREAAGRGAERMRKRLPSCWTSVSVSESRSAMTSGQEARALLAT